MGYAKYGYNSGAKKSIVNLYINHNYTKQQLLDMYHMSRTSLRTWIKQYENEEDLEEYYCEDFIKYHSLKED